MTIVWIGTIRKKKNEKCITFYKDQPQHDNFWGRGMIVCARISMIKVDRDPCMGGFSGHKSWWPLIVEHRGEGDKQMIPGTAVYVVSGQKMGSGCSFVSLWVDQIGKVAGPMVHKMEINLVL